MIDWAKLSLKDFAALLSEELRKKGIDTVLVGGACVTIYSENLYQSYDLDFVTYKKTREIRDVLQSLGFKEKDKYFYYKDCPWLVEFLAPPVAIGEESIRKFNDLKTPFGTIKLLRPIDSVKDRLASYYHWNDKMGLKQALNICLMQKIDISEIEEWSKNEKQEQKFKYLKKCF